jgi:bifunctional DNA-binding transcriptional regulator/antitoxin component of YhaV-PrlF toxin-antitoxin module
VGIVALTISPALGQGPANDRSCNPQDKVEIVDDTEGRAIVTYYNSSEECSVARDYVITSAAGIKVRVIITIGSNTDQGREIIELVPLDPAMMAYPPEGRLTDGETQHFLIQEGLS